MNKEQQELLDEAYRKYADSHQYFVNGWLHVIPMLHSNETFINECIIDTEFSEKWRLKIEERELSLDERAKLHSNTEMFYNINGTFSIQNSIEDSNFPDKNWLHEQFDKGGIPTKLITITYNDKTIESYEYYSNIY
jgi:hypothetical protein